MLHMQRDVHSHSFIVTLNEIALAEGGRGGRLSFDVTLICQDEVEADGEEKEEITELCVDTKVNHIYQIRLGYQIPVNGLVFFSRRKV